MAVFGLEIKLSVHYEIRDHMLSNESIPPFLTYRISRADRYLSTVRSTGSRMQANRKSKMVLFASAATTQTNDLLDSTKKGVSQLAQTGIAATVATSLLENGIFKSSILSNYRLTSK
jgi:hypothetical protein